jgi:hypothetical protein
VVGRPVRAVTFVEIELLGECTSADLIEPQNIVHPVAIDIQHARTVVVVLARHERWKTAEAVVIDGSASRYEYGRFS